jgi:hypothetical protein
MARTYPDLRSRCSSTSSTASIRSAIRRTSSISAAARPCAPPSVAPAGAMQSINGRPLDEHGAMPRRVPMPPVRDIQEVEEGIAAVARAERTRDLQTGAQAARAGEAA